MSKILLTNTNLSWNKGSAAQVISVVSSLRRIIPEIEFTLLSYCPKLDLGYCSRYDIKVIGYSRKNHSKYQSMFTYYSLYMLFTILSCVFYSLLRALKLNLNISTIKNDTIRTYFETDLILDLSGDSFSDWQNRSIINMLTLMPAILLRKPFVFFSQSIGPFNFWTRPIAKFFLNKSELIVIREQVTKQYLECIGVNNCNLFLAGDCAYLLESAPLTRVLEILKDHNFTSQEAPLIGISVSVFMMDHFFKGQGADYLSVISRMVDYLIVSKGVHVVLIPHSIAPIYWGIDDIYAIKGVHRLIEKKRRVRIIDKDYDPRELKGIIGCCDFFIGSRMHANIAAISQNIPTIALGWSHKYYGIMKRVGMEAYVLNIDNLSFEELKAKVDSIFSMKEKTKESMIIATRIERNSAQKAIKLVSNLLS